MAAALFPTWAVPALATEEAGARNAADFRAGPRLDFDAGDVTTDGTGRAVMLDGYATWAQWCEKTFLTQRGAYPIYPADHGIDWEGCLAFDVPAIQQGAIEAELRAALGRDPRTREVRDLAFSRSGDVLNISLTVVPVAGAPLALDRAVASG